MKLKKCWIKHSEAGFCPLGFLGFLTWDILCESLSGDHSVQGSLDLWDFRTSDQLYRALGLSETASRKCSGYSLFKHPQLAVAGTRGAPSTETWVESSIWGLCYLFVYVNHS